MGLDRTSRVLFGVAAGGLGSILVAAGLVGIRGEVANVNVALVLVLVVLAAASVGGHTAGAMSGLVAATSFDFFHTRPYGSLKIEGANDLVTTLLLVVVGLVMGDVAERRSRFRARMMDDQRHLRRLHRVVNVAASGHEDERDLVLTVTAELMDTLGLADCSFELPPFQSELPRLEPDGVMSGSPRRYAQGGLVLPRGGVELRVAGPRGIVGRFVLVPTPNVGIPAERLLVATALADELGLACAAMAS